MLMRIMAKFSQLMFFLVSLSFCMCEMVAKIELPTTPPKPPSATCTAQMILKYYLPEDQSEVDIIVEWWGEWLGSNNLENVDKGEPAFHIKKWTYRRVQTTIHGYAMIEAPVVNDLKTGIWRFSTRVNNDSVVSFEKEITGEQTNMITFQRNINGIYNFIQ